MMMIQLLPCKPRREGGALQKSTTKRWIWLRRALLLPRARKGAWPILVDGGDASLCRSRSRAIVSNPFLPTPESSLCCRFNQDQYGQLIVLSQNDWETAVQVQSVFMDVLFFKADRLILVCLLSNAPYICQCSSGLLPFITSTVLCICDRPLIVFIRYCGCAVLPLNRGR